MTVADRAYVMAQGRIVLEGNTADLRNNVDRVEASYFAQTEVGS
jgi:ABC-type branched-subunit amino acid transport system ATPase component